MQNGENIFSPKLLNLVPNEKYPEEVFLTIFR